MVENYNFGEYIGALDHGYVRLLDIMGDDQEIVNAARISYDGKGKSADRALIRYLLRHKHTSPFEMAELKFELKMPIFVARQWVRHRTANMNEMSARYTELPDDMFVPEELNLQSVDNKQGRGDQLDSRVEGEMIDLIDNFNKTSYEGYQELLAAGVARETARGILPLNIYTKFVWKMDLHNLMHFLHLRLHPHAQEEIREYAEIIQNFVQLYFPMTYEAFVDYVRDSYTCSKMEVEVIREHLAILAGYEVYGGSFDIDSVCISKGMTEREIKEFKERFLDV
jgi:thymidylate synthase (FAD)